MRSPARTSFFSLQNVGSLCQIVENYGYLRRLYLAFPTFRHDLALIVDDLTQFSHGELLENERLLALIAEFLYHLDEGLVLFVEASRGGKEKDASKLVLVKFAEDVEQLLRLSSRSWRNETKRCRKCCKGLTVVTFDPFRCTPVDGDGAIHL